jgi:hypothetical protein
MTTEIEQHASALLERLYESHKADGESREAVAAFVGAADLSKDYGETLIRLLETNGYVDAFRTLGGSMPTITAAGIHAVQQLQAERADPKTQAANLRTAMLLWLDGQEENSSTPTSWDAFLESDEHRDGYSDRQIRHAAEYLSENQLIKALKAWGETDGWLRPGLTVAGRTCVSDFGGDVNEYLNRGTARQVTNHSTTTTNVHVVDNHGNMSVAAQDFTQNITNNTGLDAELILKVLELAGGTHQLAPTLNLPAEDEHQLVEVADELHAEASGDKPNPGRLRQLVEKIYEGVKRATPTVAQKTLEALAEGSIKALAGG